LREILTPSLAIASFCAQDDGRAWGARAGPTRRALIKRTLLGSFEFAASFWFELLGACKHGFASVEGDRARRQRWDRELHFLVVGTVGVGDAEQPVVARRRARVCRLRLDFEFDFEFPSVRPRTPRRLSSGAALL
jgi:hypothetical protein